MPKAIAIIWLCFVTLVATFESGMWAQKHWHGEARVYTGVDEHTPLNHGQKSVEITLPDGVSFANFGSCGPQWHVRHVDDTVAYWRSVTIDIERYDAEHRAFVAVPDDGQHWVQVDRP